MLHYNDSTYSRFINSSRLFKRLHFHKLNYGVIMSKPFWQSKTFWVGIFVFVASILVSLGVVDIPLDPDAAWVGIAWGIVQTILRFITGSPLAATKKAKL